MNIEPLEPYKTDHEKILCRCKLKDCVYMTEEFIANLKNISVDSLLEHINNNVKKVFTKIK